jgi:methylglutaconyl-CoA hydratase
MAKAGSAKKDRTASGKRGASANRARTTYETIDVAVRNAVAIVVLNRPEVHNAFNETLIGELTAALGALDRDPEVRAVVLAGAGESFCAGADLNWMKKMAAFSQAQNLADANALAAMLATLDTLSKPTIARVHGAVFGGGVGLVACCDIAIGTQDAVFSFSEARLGLIPATIGPYVVAAIGARAARRYFLTAERFTAAEAYRLGLLHDLALPEELDARVNELLGTLLTAGPRAQTECKALLNAIANRPVDARMIADTARRIARVRSSPEGTEGVAAFLAKRKAAWVPRGE